ncbi:MAG: hypothetical protein N2645_02830 [Clostridia bacterium]|nr:hypothetical protein [Clostridia bacterium]
MGLLITIFASFLGMAYFYFGKKRTEFSFLIFGILLMVYSYFTTSLFMNITAAIVLAAAPWFIRRIF